MTPGFWFRPSPWRYLLWPLSVLFGAVSRLRRALYRAGLLSAYRSPLPVIVVGNLSVGGNGKTPVVIWLVERLQAAGYRPGVVSRGYGGQAARYPLLLTPTTSTAEAGDEPVLIARRTGCPVAVAPKRAEAVRCLEQQGVDVILCDDGLQHYALARDLELVVMDGERRLGNGALLPMGPLREGAERLASVTAVICNGGTPQPGELAMTLVPALPRRVLDDSTGLEAREVDALAGIGHPPRFFATLRQLGYRLVQAVPFADHQAFDAQALHQQFSQRPLLMTEKDAVKCRAFALADWWYLPVAAQLPDALAQRILTFMKERSHGTGS
ncbi:tetraacyldisaccharide 4'-kinase [Pseudaeromonas paramecii]|uniref:Tetraacyldisaccharide 4'-kinase n=1 Tax=Pseudaeromonas paramecii TaxID=2138166 RepID=A0ABP8QFU8_9GAMM